MIVNRVRYYQQVDLDQDFQWLISSGCFAQDMSLVQISIIWISFGLVLLHVALGFLDAFYLSLSVCHTVIFIVSGSLASPKYFVNSNSICTVHQIFLVVIYFQLCRKPFWLSYDNAGDPIDSDTFSFSFFLFFFDIFQFPLKKNYLVFN